MISNLYFPNIHMLEYMKMQPIIHWKLMKPFVYWRSVTPGVLKGSRTRWGTGRRRWMMRSPVTSGVLWEDCPQEIRMTGKGKSQFFRIPSPTEGGDLKQSTRDGSWAHPLVAHHSATVAPPHARDVLPGASEEEEETFGFSIYIFNLSFLW